MSSKRNAQKDHDGSIFDYNSDKDLDMESPNDKKRKQSTDSNEETSKKKMFWKSQKSFVSTFLKK